MLTPVTCYSMPSICIVNNCISSLFFCDTSYKENYLWNLPVHAQYKYALLHSSMAQKKKQDVFLQHYVMHAARVM